MAQLFGSLCSIVGLTYSLALQCCLGWNILLPALVRMCNIDPKLGNIGSTLPSSALLLSIARMFAVLMFSSSYSGAKLDNLKTWAGLNWKPLFSTTEKEEDLHYTRQLCVIIFKKNLNTKTKKVMFFCRYSVSSFLFSALAARAVLSVHILYILFFFPAENIARDSFAHQHVVTCTLVTVNLCVKEWVRTIITLYDHVVLNN